MVKSQVKNIIYIILQLFLLQCIFIIPLMIVILILPIKSKFYFLFSFTNLNTANFLYLICYFLNIIPLSLGIRFIVERFKLCWDFAITVFFNQYLLISLLNITFIPTMSWLIVNIFACILTILLSEYLCKFNELRDISFTNTQLLTPIPLKSISID